MNPATLLVRRLARLSLLLAAALQILGAAAGPWAHIAALAPAPAEAVERPGDPAPGQPQPHDELGCLLCHAAGALALPFGGETVPLPLLATSPAPAEPPLPAGLGSSLRPSARAPPLS